MTVLDFCLTILTIFQLGHSNAFNDTHLLGHNGGQNGFSEDLSIIVCHSSICYPIRLLELHCLEYHSCSFPCDPIDDCMVSVSKLHMCLRYQCKKVII